MDGARMRLSFRAFRSHTALRLRVLWQTTAKEEAMAYARRASGMILFEIQQGFVARGASISWLSQYVPHTRRRTLPSVSRPSVRPPVHHGFLL